MGGLGVVQGGLVIKDYKYRSQPQVVFSLVISRLSAEMTNVTILSSGK